MANECYLEITFLKKDKDRLREIFGNLEDEFWDGVNEEDAVSMSVYMNYANYGLYEQREDAAREGIIFRGWHGDGGDYNSRLFVSWGNVLIEVDEVEKFPVVRVSDNGSVFKEDLELARKFIATRKSFDLFLKSQVGNGNAGSQPS